MNSVSTTNSKEEVPKQGFTVRIKYTEDCPYPDEVFENITEIHYCYPSLGSELSTAFESDIELTGCTRFNRWIKEFEAILVS